MSKHWFYELEISSDKILSADYFNTIMNIIKQSGFIPFNPETGLITGIYNSVPFESDNYLKVSELLCKEGGIIELWHDNISVFLFLEYKDNQTTLISIIVNKSLFEIVKKRNWLSENIKTLFIELCRQLRPYYAYSGDDDIYPEIVSEEINNQGFAGVKPDILYWINYFDINFLERIGGIDTFKSFACKINEIPGTGSFVSFTEYPWEFNLENLQLINDKWQIIKMAYNIHEV